MGNKAQEKSYIKSFLSGTHLRAAILLVENCRKSEEQKLDNDNQLMYKAYSLDSNAYASATIITSFAFVESTINEFYQECHDDKNYTLVELPDDVVTIIGHLWQHDKFETLEKYQIALAVAKKRAVRYWEAAISRYGDVEKVKEFSSSL